MRMRLVRKKSQNTLETRSTGIVGKGLDSQLCHYWEPQTLESAGVSHLKAPSRDIKSQSGGAYNRVFNFGSPQTQGGGVQSY